MAFTGNKDIDRAILLKLDDVDLSNICQTDKYFKSLCSEESFWRTKTLQRFGNYLGDVSSIEKYMIKYKFKTWKSYYVSLVDFLEKKYLGYFIPYKGGGLKVIRKFEDFRNTSLKREDIKKLNKVIDENDSILMENIRNFIIDSKEFKNFMDNQLDKDLLNPSSVFISSFEENSIDEYYQNIFTYLLNSKDRRIHPEYFDNELLKKLVVYEDPYDEEGKLFKMVLNDERVDPNSLLGEIAIDEIPDDYIQLVLVDPRVKLDNIRNTIKENIEDEILSNGFLEIFEAFLKKGGSLSELEYMIKNIQNRNEEVIENYEKFIEEHKNVLEQQIISKLSSKKYSDDTYRQILALL